VRSDSIEVVGWDIGGVNIKAVRVIWNNGEIAEMDVAIRPFEIWRQRDKLTNVLREIGDQLGVREKVAMAATMTAELSDAFRNKREGVLFILDAMDHAFPNTPVYLLSLTGDLVPLKESRHHPISFAATNWVASALLVAHKYPDCIFVDVGSTTTDIIPIRGGRVNAKGFTDMDRLVSGELVYSGVLRTNPNTLAKAVPVDGRMCRVSAEYFTVMGDIYIILGLLKSDSYTCPTPDGRSNSLEAAQERLARLVCTDLDALNGAQVFKIARFLFEKQLQMVAEALLQVLSRQEDGLQATLVTAGAGAFVAIETGRRLGMKIIDLGQEWGEKAIKAFPSVAVADILARRIDAGRR